MSEEHRLWRDRERNSSPVQFMIDWLLMERVLSAPFFVVVVVLCTHVSAERLLLLH